MGRNPGFAALLADFNSKAGALTEEEEEEGVSPEQETAAPGSPPVPGPSFPPPGMCFVLLLSPSWSPLLLY